MVGSADFNNAAIEGQVNITTSAQQPGSAIKPVVYAAAFEQGWHPGTVVLDAPIRIETPGATDPVTGEEMPSTSLRTTCERSTARSPREWRWRTPSTSRR